MGLALGPLMEEYGVQAYFCGHEHNLQYLHAQGEPTHYIVSGGGSQVGSYGNFTGQDLLLFHPGSGDGIPLLRLPHQSHSARAPLVCPGSCSPCASGIWQMTC